MLNYIIKKVVKIPWQPQWRTRRITTKPAAAEQLCCCWQKIWRKLQLSFIHQMELFHSMDSQCIVRSCLILYYLYYMRISMYFVVAPLCYLYSDPESLYFTFRSFYSRFWYNLHEISSNENGIVALCILFQQLLQKHENQLYFHFKMLRISP